MKIYIVTIHAMRNPGSVLQAYALQKYLELKNEVYIIDYRPDYIYSEGSKMKLFIKKMLHPLEMLSRDQKFNEFINRELRLTNRFVGIDDLKAADLRGDVFIAGSDQLWNTDFSCGNDPVFYLEFTNRGRKISYSTSVGKKKIDEKNRDMLFNHTKQLEYIAVREKDTANQLTAMLQRNVYWVCDPVFLIGNVGFKKFIQKQCPIKEPYVMVYLSPKSKALDEIVDFYHRRGVKIILAGGMTKRCFCDKHIKNVGPVDFLNLIYYAESVVSTSFHATAFSILFHTEFVSIIPPKNGERINSILDAIGLQNRAVNGEIDYRQLEKKIEWHNVDWALEKHVDQSKAYLKMALH